MRSLFIEYPRMESETNVSADLLDLKHTYLNLSLPVLSAHSKGIEVKVPSWLSGIFYLKIRDGEDSILRRISIQ